MDTFQDKIEKHLLTHCAPIFFLQDREARPSAIENNGTVALIDTGERKVLVTCAHVWREFENLRAENTQTQLSTIFADGFGRPHYIPFESLIDIDDGLDLAVISATPEQWNFGPKRFYETARWPITDAARDYIVVFAGFAGSSRVVAEDLGMFSYSFFGLHVTDVSSRSILVANDRGDRRLIGPNGSEIPPMRMSGLSGSPVYVFSERGFLLTGFVRMGANSDGLLTIFFNLRPSTC